MSDISICFNKKDFEYDVYTLVKAFYPEEKITTFYKGENTHPADAGLKLDVDMFEDKLEFTYDDGADVKTSSCAVDKNADRTQRKNILKRMIYDTISCAAKRTLPWGTLTGIRPTKIPMKLLNEGMERADIERYMRKSFYTSEKKAELAVDIAFREKQVLESIDIENGYSLYIGIPFCPSICLYCSFGSHPIDKWGHMVDDYLNALYKELLYIASAMKDKRLCSIYIGGGTPTTLSAAQLRELISHIRGEFDLSRVREFTVEAGRPDTIDEDKLAALKESGVNRISINPQSMNDKTLEIIGRSHTQQQIVSAFEIARAAGFDNINMDLIAGLPGEGETEVASTMSKIEALRPDCLTIHSLALKRATRLNLYKDEYADVSFKNSQDIMDIIDRGARRMEMLPYYMYRQKNIAGNLENTGYAREGCFGLYNILIMEEVQSILAAGSGAMSKFVFEGGRIERAENVKDLRNYIERVDEMCLRKEKYIRCS